MDKPDSQRQELTEVRSRRRASAAKARARRPAGDDDLHDDQNQRVAHENLSEQIALEAHGIDLTTDATEWRRYSNLTAPDPLPGYHQRWIRVRLSHKNDPSNVYRRFREGWRPRPVTTLPDGHSLPTVQLGQFGECIGVEDMVLCQMPDKVFQQMRKYYKGKQQAQTASTERELESLSVKHQVPIYRTKVTKMGRAPGVASD